MSLALLERITQRPDRNVGQSDFVTRALATVALIGLLALVIPQTGSSFSLMKICLLIAAELGLVSLMLGLFLRTKTYFAGLQLFGTPLVMFWLVAHQLPYLAFAVGVVMLVIGVMNLVTRRSRLNQLLNMSSLRPVIEGLVPEPKSKSPPHDAGARS